MMPLPGSGSRTEKLRFVAGGIGITPILPMVRLAARLGVPWSLCYTGRHRDSLPFVDELLCIRRPGAGAHRRRARTAVLDRPPGRGRRPDRGVRVWPAAAARGCPSGYPARLGHRTACRAVLPAAGVERVALRVGAGAQLQRWWRSPRTRAPCPRCGRRGPMWRYSCQQGFCGTCVQRVVTGEVDHRDNTLTDRQRELGQMLVCVSRAKSEGGRLVLDL